MWFIVGRAGVLLGNRTYILIFDFILLCVSPHSYANRRSRYGKLVSATARWEYGGGSSFWVDDSD